MPQIKMKKHEVYDFITNHLDWFKGKSEPRFLTCFVIGHKINQELAKESSDDPPFISLSGSTLTAMVYDGVLERKFVELSRCYAYRPILPINEDYKAS